MVSTVYQEYQRIRHWKPLSEVESRKKLSELHATPLFSHAFEITKKTYQRFSKRKDGSSALSHPLSVACNLLQAGVIDEVTLCAGLMHDYVEDLVDEYRDQHDIAEDIKGVVKLDQYEEKMFEELQFDFNRQNLDARQLIDVLKLLTRHKRHIYYRSIIGIFCQRNQILKEKAILVKLADRTHNIQCLRSYDLRQKIYQGFKNLFILNNTKLFLQQKNSNPALEKLFEKCCKSTYDAFLSTCYDALDRDIGQIESLLQLAFRKFIHERKGLDQVTEFDQEELHPLGRYHGIVLKFDCRLHHEYDKYDLLNAQEKDYYKKLFADFKFNAKQLQAIVDYKDAYALKEVISYLLYKKNYFIEGFAGDNLCRDNGSK